MLRKLVGSLILCLPLSGCAGLPTGAQVIHQDEATLIRLEPDPAVEQSDPASLHAHPLRLSVEEITVILRAVDVQKGRGAVMSKIAGPAARQKAFDAQEVAVLAPWLQEALARALPAERVVFLLSRDESPESKNVLLSRSDLLPEPFKEVTSGSLFVHGPLLHLRLANYHYAVDPVQGGPGESRWQPNTPLGDQDFELRFNPEEFATRPEVGTLARWFRVVRPELLINYAGFLAAEKNRAAPGPGALAGNQRPGEGPAVPPVGVARPAVKEDNPSPSPASGSAPPIQVLSDQLRLLQQLLEQKQLEVLRLSTELENAKRDLAARDSLIKQLKAEKNSTKPTKPPKPPVP